MAKQSISVTLEPQTIEYLKMLAAKEYRNISNMIDYIVAQYVLQQHEPVTTKYARASLLAEEFEITPYQQTQTELAKNVHLDDEDLEYIKNLKGKLDV